MPDIQLTRNPVRVRLAAALAACNLQIADDKTKPLSIHSHCAGLDAVALSFRALGITVSNVASECDPSVALAHLLHHRKTTDHLITDIKTMAQGCEGPCYKHGGRICTWSPTTQLLFSSFVCKPYSRANSKRIKTMNPSDGDSGVQTYHMTKECISQYRPHGFVLENGDGVSAKHPPTSTAKNSDDTHADFMLDDLRAAGYSVEKVSSIRASDFGVCQARPRTLFFGVREDHPTTAKDVVQIFMRLSAAYHEVAGPMAKIDESLTYTSGDALSDDDDDSAGQSDDRLSDTANYIVEYVKARDHMKTAFPEVDFPLLSKDARPSAHAPHKTSNRVKATIDVLSLAHGMHVRGCSNHDGCQCHPLADVSQRADRCHFKTDGSVPTLTTGSLIFSYKMKRFVHPTELLKSMGYGSVNLAPLPKSAQRRVAGNGYAVPVCATAVAAIATVVGRIKKTSAQSSS